jgi:hypothetical protein
MSQEVAGINGIIRMHNISGQQDIDIIINRLDRRRGPQQTFGWCPVPNGEVDVQTLCYLALDFTPRHGLVAALAPLVTLSLFYSLGLLPAGTSKYLPERCHCPAST